MTSQTIAPDRATDDASPNQLAADILDTLAHRIGKDAQAARPHDWLAATILTIRNDIIDRWMESTRQAHAAGAKRVYYLSLEFLIGRLLRDAIANLGRTAEVSAALKTLGVDLAEIEEIEPDAALGNGGLGRLAACFMESLASLDLPAYGYGIRYVNGMFRQRIDDGWQVELPETWLAHGNPWEFERAESAYAIGFGGESNSSGNGSINRAEKISLTIAAVVTHVLPNGNMMIQGRQEVRTNQELRELTVAGIVRPEDISAANTIRHTQIAEARIGYGGRGALTRAQQVPAGQAIIERYTPF